jgi:hypothetical protein
VFQAPPDIELLSESPHQICIAAINRDFQRTKIAAAALFQRSNEETY